MNPIVRISIAVPLALYGGFALAACGDEPSNDAISSVSDEEVEAARELIDTQLVCFEGVDKPLADVYTAGDDSPECAPGVSVTTAGCYPGGVYDESTPLVAWFVQGEGWYFGRTGGELHYQEPIGTTTAQMAEMAGCK